MQTAASALDFESAAKYRDQIDNVKEAIAKQNLDNPSAENEDVIGVAQAGDEACVQVLMIRGGKLIEREHYFLRNSSDSHSRGADRVCSTILSRCLIHSENHPTT